MLQQLFGSNKPRTLLGFCLFAHLLFSLPALAKEETDESVGPTSAREISLSDADAAGRVSLVETLRQRAEVASETDRDHRSLSSEDPSPAETEMRVDPLEEAAATRALEDDLQKRAQGFLAAPPLLDEAESSAPTPAMQTEVPASDDVRAPMLRSAAESSGVDGIDQLWGSVIKLKRRVSNYLQDKKKHKERSKAFWNRGEELRKKFLSSSTEINDTQLVIINEVMEEYARVRKWKLEQIAALGERHWEGEAEDLEAMIKTLDVEEHRQNFIQRIDEKTRKPGSGAARVAEIEEEYDLLQNNLPAYVRRVGLFHLKKLIDRKELGGSVNANTRTRLMLAMEDEDSGGSYGRAQIVTRIVHNASQLSFVIYPKDGLSADAKHLSLIKARQLYDTEQPTYDRPEGGAERFGMSTVAIGLEDSDDMALDDPSVQTVPRPYDVREWDIRKKTRRMRWPTSLPMPLPIGVGVDKPDVAKRAWSDFRGRGSDWKRDVVDWKRDWADWKTATWVPVDIEKAKFGVFVCGAFQFLFMAMLSHNDWGNHPEKYNAYSVWYPAFINFAFGATIGMNVGSYLNLKRRGNVTDLLIFNQFISLLCSYTMYALTTPAKLLIWTKHVHIFLNSYINSKARTAWNGWVTVRDQIRYGNDPVEIDLSKWWLPLVNRVHIKMKKLKWSHWFGQAYIDQAPWIPKSIDLVMSLHSVGGYELPEQIAELNIPSKLAMLAMIPVAHYLIIRDMREIARLPEYANNANFRFHLAKQEKIWAERNFFGKMNRRVKAAFLAMVDEEHLVQDEAARERPGLEKHLAKVGRRLSAGFQVLIGKKKPPVDEATAREQADLLLREEQARHEMSLEKRSERVMYEHHCEEVLVQPHAA